jgi:hypothetical protein
MNKNVSGFLVSLILLAVGWEGVASEPLPTPAGAPDTRPKAPLPRPVMVAEPVAQVRTPPADAASRPVGTETPALPSAADISAAREKVEDIFSTEYASAKTADAKSKLAKQLASHATPDQSPAARVALLREAARLATDAGDATTALDAVEKLISGYDGDRDAAMLAVYQQLLRTVSPANATDLGQSILRFTETALRGGREESAAKAVPLLLGVARKSRDPLLLKAAGALKLRVAEQASLDGKITPLRAKLAESPDDPQANLELGQLLCFTAGNWREGLPYLAKGGDATLAAVAAAELAAGERVDPKVAVALADAWCDCAQKQRGPLRMAAENRALDHYTAATGHVDGLDGVRIGKQIAQLQKNVGFKGISTPLVDLKPSELIDGAYPLFKHGSFNGARYTAQGKEWPKSLFLLPKDGKTSIMRFSLPGKHRRIQGHVGIFSPRDVPAAAQPASPAVFSVVADGKNVWQSPPLSKRDQVVKFSIDISDVTTLELHTSATGSANGAWAAWLDPELVE